MNIYPVMNRPMQLGEYARVQSMQDKNAPFKYVGRKSLNNARFGWVSREWFGNDDKSIVAKLKTFINPFTFRKTEVWVFGKDGKWNYTVHAGAASDFSYTGFCVDCDTIESACSYVDNLADTKVEIAKQNPMDKQFTTNQLFK